MRILVIGPSWIGDMMMSHSLYRTLKIRYPHSTIDVMAPAWSHPLLTFMPEVHRAILIPLHHRKLEINIRHNLGRDLRKKHYDRAYVLPNSFKSALIPFFADIPHRIGWRGEMRYGLLNDIRILDKKSFPLMVERYIALGYKKGMVQNSKDLPKPFLWPKLQINDKEKFNTCHMFGISFKRPIIGFCPGAEFSILKCWPYYHFSRLAKQLIDKGYQIALFNSKKNHEAGNKIISMLNQEQRVWCHNLEGKTSLHQAIILIASCKAIVSNDSGLMHIAAALNLPLIALYGLSSPSFTPPLSHKAYIIRLITGYYKIRKSNIAEDYHQSLINITPQNVFEILNKLLLNEKDSKCEY